MDTPLFPLAPDAEDRAGIIFFQTLTQPPEQRPAFLDAACAADPALRAEVGGLLRDYEKAGCFLEGNATLFTGVKEEFARLQPETAGDRIGLYKLLQQIGEGGFGVVWMAEQEQPVRRRVALKIIKPGMDTKEVVARFEQERQALAVMQHPNIATVLDAGVTQFGRPYFVMELVRGIKITQYCDEARLTTQGRLQLFIAVCHAVQHAHQKGIIHRDLKPSNILVTLHDGVPVPKVIDFGVAKAIQQQRLSDFTVFTRFEQMIGTPLYMSPEQAEMSGLDIDTRSDIYSLGVLLYELLTGRTPFDPGELLKQGLDEIRRVIREDEPQKPSTFVSSLALDLRSTLAQHRQSDHAKFISQIRGDLDWIVMKALEKDRNRRYGTANGFAQDIQRHLQNEPVEARPATRFYRFRRFAKRNKTAFAAGSAIAAALVLGLAASTWMFFKEKQARERAVAAEAAQNAERRKVETEASKSQQVAQFLKDMLDGVGPSVALGRDTAMLREILDKTAERVGHGLGGQPEVEAELRSTIGDVYAALGDRETASMMHEEALKRRRGLYGEAHPAIAASLHSMGKLLEPLEGEKVLREALAMRKLVLGEDHPDVARSMTAIAFSLRAQGKLSEAEIVAREALALMRKSLGRDHPDVAESLLALAQAVGHQQRFGESGELHGAALEILRKVHGNEHPSVAETLHNLAQNLRSQYRMEESETLYLEALALQEKLLGKTHPTVASTRKELADLLIELSNQLVLEGNHAKAEAKLREVLRITRDVYGEKSVEYAACLHGLGQLLERSGYLVGAEDIFSKSLEITRELHGNEDPRVASEAAWLAMFLIAKGEFARAELLAREALMIREKCMPNQWATYSARSVLGAALLKQNRLSEAEPLLLAGFEGMTQRQQEIPENALINLKIGAERLIQLCVAKGDLEKAAVWEKTHAELVDYKRLITLGQRADLLRDQGKLPQEEPLRREALALIRSSGAMGEAHLEWALVKLAENFYRQNNYAEAEPLYREILALRQARLTKDDPQDDLASGMASLARLLADWVLSERDSESADQTKTLFIDRSKEAENLLRYCLPIQQGGGEAVWRKADLQSRLGSALLAVVVADPALTGEDRHAKLTEAESLLLQGHESLQKAGMVSIKYRRDALTRLVRLYEGWQKPDQAAEWRQKLKELR